MLNEDVCPSCGESECRQERACKDLDVALGALTSRRTLDQQRMDAVLREQHHLLRFQATVRASQAGRR